MLKTSHDRSIKVLPALVFWELSLSLLFEEACASRVGLKGGLGRARTLIVNALAEYSGKISDP